MSEYKQILYSKENRVATVTLNRPEKLNAYSEIMVHEILDALADARDDDEIRALILTGAGRGFCSGGDISRDFQYPTRYRGHPPAPTCFPNSWGLSAR
jgi:enoyl-CoA hydratase/carnithine racemase